MKIMVAGVRAAREGSARGTFTAYAPSAHAVTYRPGLVPRVPARTSSAFRRRRPCGATGDAAGPHFQHVPDPVRPSTDPAYANPRNEIWLDFTTDRLGTGFARSTVDWTFAGRWAPGSPAWTWTSSHHPHERSGTTRMRTEYVASKASGVSKPIDA